jgi:predicted alpha/beta hydrolase
MNAEALDSFLWSPRERDGFDWDELETTDVDPRVTVEADDGTQLAVDYFPSRGRPQATVLLAPAMGVPRKFYARFARFLADGGLATATLDYRGIGGSRPTRLRGFDATLHDWAVRDLPAVARFLRTRHPRLPLLYVGHSVGGQLMGFAVAGEVHAALFVSSQSGHWRHWDGPRRLGMAALWNVAMPALTAARGFFPSRWVGMGEDLPAGVAREWAEWGRAREYLGVRVARSGGAFARWSGSLRAYHFPDDHFAPPRAVAALLEMYPSARRELRTVAPDSIGARSIGHFGFFRAEHAGTLWREARDWLLASRA